MFGAKSVQVSALVGKLTVNHCLVAIEATLLCVVRIDWNAESCDSVAERRGEHVCQAELRPWYKTKDLGFG